MKHIISSDENLNPALKEDITGLRGGIVGQAEKKDLPDRFNSTLCEDRPSAIITDTETGKSTRVPLFAYGEVRKALNDLFSK